MSSYENLLAAKNQTIRILVSALAVVSGLAGLLALGWMMAPSQLRIHVPPDLSSGVVLRADEVGPANVYSFGYYIWQQLYRWDKNGVTDYEDKIYMLQNYLTPSCFQDRLDDFEIRKRARELEGRRRAIWEIPGRGFSRNRVAIEGPGAWVIYLDLHIEETMLGETIKERFVAYPLRVVRYDVDPEKNPFGLALDCLAHAPTAIAMAERNKEE